MEVGFTAGTLPSRSLGTLAAIAIMFSFSQKVLILGRASEAADMSRHPVVVFVVVVGVDRIILAHGACIDHVMRCGLDTVKRPCFAGDERKIGSIFTEA